MAEAADTYTMLTQTSVPGLQFHLVARRGHTEQARELLRAVLDAVRVTGVTGRDFAHDLISAGLVSGLGVDELRPVAAAIDDPFFDDAWRWLADAQIAEAAATTAAPSPDIGAPSPSRRCCCPPRKAPVTSAPPAACSRSAPRRRPPAHPRRRAAPRALVRVAGRRAVGAARAARARRPPVAGDQALTPREREVAVLLAEGLTNAELARRLYISPRTAAVHVSNILSKLNLESRMQIAAWVKAGS